MRTRTTITMSGKGHITVPASVHRGDLKDFGKREGGS